MPPQHIEVAETVLALKKKLVRDSEAPSDRPITSATNRGNKLRRGAQYVHAGALSYPHGPNGYKERITHAGYQRYVLARNPRRYNELGDELDDSEDDAEADADAEEENPYSQVRLDELLRPLTHAAELANHPTLSQPYLDPALPEIIKDIESKLRHERANIWRAKNLYRHFVGDESWIPLEKVEDSEDWDLFAPRNTLIAGERSPKRRRLSAEIAENNIDAQDQAPTTTDDQDSKTQSKADHEADGLPDAPVDAAPASDTATSNAQNESLPDTDMADAKDDPEEPSVNGLHKGESKDNQGVENTDQQSAEDAVDMDGVDAESQTSSPAPPPRRITRALAAETNTSRPTTPDSQNSNTLSDASPSLFDPAAMFLLPPQLQLAHSSHTSGLPLSVAHSGLSPEEILETRKLLHMYIQKSEETERGLKGLYSKLIRLKRRRDKVWEWCKAEGHVGELSDGEDWIDHEAWGLRIEDLRKGRDEEEGAQQVSIELETNAEGVVERRKGKRRRGAKD